MIGRCFLLLLLCSLPARAALEFFQFTDKAKVSLEETFQLHVVVSNPPPHAQLELPSSNDFEVLSRSQSTQLQYRTGSSSQKEQRYSLTLRAKKEGRLLIPPALLKIDKTTYKTEAIPIQVVKGHANPSPSPQGNTSTPPIPRTDSDLFIQMTLDKPSVYVGQQVLLSLLLYSRTTNAAIESISMPTLKGFLSEDVELSWPLVTERKSVDGVNYHVTTLKKRALFAIQPGSYTLEPATADFVVGQLFRGREVRRTSNALTLEVKALPHSAENLPVGQWHLESKVPPGPFTAGQPVELSLTLRGTGNVRNLPPLELVFSDTFKTFPPTAQNNTQILGNKLSGSRTLQYVVIPQEAGNFTIPAVNFDFFNPETEKAESTQTPPLMWVVLPANADNASGSASLPTDTPGPDFLEQEKMYPIRHKAELSPPSPSPTQKSTYWMLVALPVALRFLGMLLRFAFSKMGTSAQKQQRRREKSATNAICTSVGELKANPCTLSFSRLGKNIMAFLECKLGFSTQGLTQEQLHSKMQEQGLPEHICQRVLYVLAECDAMQFGHASPSAQSIDKACEASLHILKRWP
jgi:hypothetical protein